MRAGSGTKQNSQSAVTYRVTIAPKPNGGNDEWDHQGHLDSAIHDARGRFDEENGKNDHLAQQNAHHSTVKQVWPETSSGFVVLDVDVKELITVSEVSDSEEDCHEGQDDGGNTRESQANKNSKQLLCR